MRISIDCRSEVPTLTGLGRYAHTLAAQLPGAGPDHTYFIVGRQNDEAIDQLVEEHQNVQKIETGAGPCDCVWEQFQLPRLLERHDIDVFHGTSFVGPVVRPPTCAIVVTVHDLFYEELPHLYTANEREYLRKWVSVSVRAADSIIAVSEFTREALATRFALDDTPTHVIPEAPAPMFRREEDEGRLRSVQARYELPESFLLFVGSLSGRKNLARLAQAYRRLIGETAVDCDLVLVGSPHWSSGELLRTLCELGLDQRVRRPGFVEDADLPALYSLARAFVLPSISEGCGLPVLEAMACGTPVTTSDAGALPETAGDAALLFDPEDVEAMSDALVQIVSNKALRATLVKRGFQRLQHFNAATMASQTLSVYRLAHDRLAPPGSDPTCDLPATDHGASQVLLVGLVWLLASLCWRLSFADAAPPTRARYWAESRFSVPVPDEHVRAFEALARWPALRGETLQGPMMPVEPWRPNWWHSARPKWYVPFFRDPNPRVRRAAVMASDGPADSVYALLDDPDLDVVDAALWAILRPGGVGLRHPARVCRGLTRVLAGWNSGRCMGLRALGWGFEACVSITAAIPESQQRTFLAQAAPAATAPGPVEARGVEWLIATLCGAKRPRLRSGQGIRIAARLEPFIVGAANGEAAKALLALIGGYGVFEDVDVLERMISSPRSSARVEDVIAAARAIVLRGRDPDHIRSDPEPQLRLIRAFGPWIESRSKRERAAAQALVSDRRMQEALRGPAGKAMRTQLGDSRYRRLLAVPGKVYPLSLSRHWTEHYRFASPLPGEQVWRFEYECYRFATEAKRHDIDDEAALLPYLTDRRPRVVESALRAAGGYASPETLISIMAVPDVRCSVAAIETFWRDSEWLISEGNMQPDHWRRLAREMARWPDLESRVLFPAPTLPWRQVRGHARALLRYASKDVRTKLAAVLDRPAQ